MKKRDVSEMKKSTDKQIVKNETVKITGQLKDGATLKYPRRSKRTIANNSFELAEPTSKVSATMQKIRSSNTSIELILEEKLKLHLINYTRPEQLIESIEGNPDFVVPKYRIAIFCDGDFWHGYQLDKSAPKSNSEFWRAKIENNI